MPSHWAGFMAAFVAIYLRSARSAVLGRYPVIMTKFYPQWILSGFHLREGTGGGGALAPP